MIVTVGAAVVTVTVLVAAVTVAVVVVTTLVTVTVVVSVVVDFTAVVVGAGEGNLEIQNDCASGYGDTAAAMRPITPVHVAAYTELMKMRSKP